MRTRTQMLRTVTAIGAPILGRSGRPRLRAYSPGNRS